MERLSKKADIEQAQTAFDAVFKSSDPFGEPFQDAIRSRILIYEASRPLDRWHFDNIAYAADVAGNTSAFIAVTETARDFRKMELWKLDLSDTDEWKRYRAGKPDAFYNSLENALYSADGTWGLLVSCEDHGLLGGSDEFVQAFLSRNGANAADVVEFLDRWEKIRRGDLKLGNAKELEWLLRSVPNVLRHVYGDHGAIRFHSEILGIDIDVPLFPRQ